MDTKSKVLAYLMKNKNKNVSGEKIAEELLLSRTAVWQAIGKLKLSGHEITSSGNKGYCYVETDIMSQEGIKHYLPAKLKEIPIIYYDEIDSTNKQAKIDAANNKNNITLYVTPFQTGGYGRFGRAFVGDASGGIYMSLVLQNIISADNVPLITIKTAVAEKRAIDSIAHIDTKIKWVNDIFHKGKKVSGILTEGITDYETGTISTIIIGIGINFAVSRFPAELKNIAGSIFDKKPKNVFRNELVALFLKEFFDIYGEKDQQKIITEYKEASNVLGKKVTFIKDNVDYEGKAIDIDDDGQLIVLLKNRQKVSLFSGEISIKLPK